MWMNLHATIVVQAQRGRDQPGGPRARRSTGTVPSPGFAADQCEVRFCDGMRAELSRELPRQVFRPCEDQHTRRSLRIDANGAKQKRRNYNSEFVRERVDTNGATRRQVNCVRVSAYGTHLV